MENKKTREFDMFEMTKKVFADYKCLFLFVLIFAAIGIIYALNKPKTYTANVVLAPEINSKMGASESMSDLASMVGIDMSSIGGSVDAIYPDIYPDVFASSDFIVSLFNVPVRKKDDERIQTYYNYLTTDQKIPFWSYPMIWLSKIMKPKGELGHSRGLNPFQLTKKQDEIVRFVRANIACLIDKKTNVITISVNDQDPMVAAVMADTLQSRLQKYITQYRTQKARNDLAYTQKLFVEAKDQYVKARQKYANFGDANTDLILESYKLKQEDLENEMQLRFNTYSQVSQQLQVAKAKVQEHTPAFTIIQQASVPLKASSFPRSITVVIFIFFGILCDALWILKVRDALGNRKRKNKE